jgi:hypothetical protein
MTELQLRTLSGISSAAALAGVMPHGDVSKPGLYSLWGPGGHLQPMQPVVQGMVKGSPSASQDSARSTQLVEPWRRVDSTGVCGKRPREMATYPAAMQQHRQLQASYSTASVHTAAYAPQPCIPAPAQALVSCKQARTQLRISPVSITESDDEDDVLLISGPEAMRAEVQFWR